MPSPLITYSETKYKSINGLTTDTTGGALITNDQKIAIYRFRANGSDPNCYVSLAWDYGGGAEKIFASTKGDIDILFDVTLSDNQITGDGSKRLKVILINNNVTSSPVIGGSFEVVTIG